MEVSTQYAVDSLILEKIHSGKWLPEPATGKIYSRELGRYLAEHQIRGYSAVSLGATDAYVSRIIWIAAHGIPEISGLQIDHINEIKTDNRLENLRLITPAGNIRHSQAKVHYADAERIREIYAKGNISQRELGRMYGISKTGIHRILTLKRHAHPKREGKVLDEAAKIGIFTDICCRGIGLAHTVAKYHADRESVFQAIEEQSLKIKRARAEDLP